MRKIRVLIVEDSRLYQEVLKRGLSTDPQIEVVAQAADPFVARDKILAYRPDVMTCDLEMPRMNGIEFIRRLMPQYPLPVVVVSSVSQAVFQALHAGAVDFVTKPDLNAANSVERFLKELIHKLKIAVTAKIKLQVASEGLIPPAKRILAAGEKIIAIGASTGGTEAIYQILQHLPPTLPGIVIVQHIPPVFSRMFAERLNAFTSLTVKEAQNGDCLEPGKVVVAPGDQHIRIKKQGDGYRVECFDGEKVNGHCPSIDVLFESVAKEAGHQGLGIILTGMGYDGAKGLLSMKRKGARTIGQSESSCIVYGMPKVAYEIGAVERQVSLELIPQLLTQILSQET